METSNMKNMVVLKNLPSNLVEEAIIILKSNKKVKKLQKIEKKRKQHERVENLKKEGYTIVYITNVAEEMLLADRIIVLNEGKIVAEVKKDEIINKLEIFRQYDIKLPLVIEMVEKLRQEGIDMNLSDYSMDELIKKIKEMAKK